MDQKSSKKLPKELEPLFWSYDFSALDLEKDKELILIQIINLGSLTDWQWLNRIYGKDEIRNMIGRVSATTFRPGALKLASLLFSVDKLNYAPRSSNR